MSGHVYDPDQDGFCRFPPCQRQEADCSGTKPRAEVVPLPDSASRPAPRRGQGDKGTSTRDVSRSASSVPFGATIIRLADVESERVRWLWLGYLPLGKLVVLDGD